MQRRRLKGFTLFELLLTLLLISLTVSLIAPNLFNTFRAAGEKTTLKQLQTDIEALRLKAFLQENTVQVVMKSESLQAFFTAPKSLIEESQYPGIQFVTSELNISPRGILTPTELELLVDERPIFIDFKRWP